MEQAAAQHREYEQAVILLNKARVDARTEMEAEQAATATAVAKSVEAATMANFYAAAASEAVERAAAAAERAAVAAFKHKLFVLRTIS